jgi:hypothetical protein
MEEAVIRAALAGITLALAGMAVVTGTAVIGTAVTGMVEAVAGIMVVTVVAGELAPQ